MDNNAHPILEDAKKQYDKEQDELLKTVLDMRFFQQWKLHTKYTDNRCLQNNSKLELYITNTCNQKCSYCYLTKYPELYPSECNNPETILHNLKILYNYITMNRFYIPAIDFFSGEIWHTQLGYDILDLTYKYITEYHMDIGKLSIPTNAYFITKEETFHKMQNYLNNYNAIGVPLDLSLSVDGKYVDNTMRERNNDTQYTDEFYDRLFTFAKVNNSGFHPMISAQDIDLWEDNFKWWADMCNKYNINLIDRVMFLEVRNDDWTTEKIDKFCDLIKQMAEYYLKTECHDDVAKFANALIGIIDNQTPLAGYYPWLLTKNNTTLGCTSSTHMCVRLGDLAICPCHRQAYNKYLFGKFVVEDDTIVDIKAINPYMAIKMLMGNIHYCINKCDTCPINHYCLKGCYGSQLETLKDPFFPIESVCNLFKAKFTTLVEFYSQLGVYDYLTTIPMDNIRANIAASYLQTKIIMEDMDNE